jgi:hypothetical protein
MAIDYDNLEHEKEQTLAHFLVTSEIRAGGGQVLPTYEWPAAWEREEDRKQAIRDEFMRRGYSEHEVSRIESGDWSVLDGRNV